MMTSEILISWLMLSLRVKIYLKLSEPPRRT
jgi:hypothetical protein